MEHCGTFQNRANYHKINGKKRKKERKKAIIETTKTRKTNKQLKNKKQSITVVHKTSLSRQFYHVIFYQDGFFASP